MLSISELYIYPVKSLGGVAVNEAKLTDRGFEHDRRWMLVDAAGKFISQREVNEMSLLRVSITDENLLIHHLHKQGHILSVPLHNENDAPVTVNIWDDVCEATYISKEADAWFSEILSQECRLVYMPDDTRRLVDLKYAHHNEITSFSDGYPLLIIGQASLDDLNEKLTEPLPINRFRPNIVFTGGYPFQEDDMKAFEINGINFYGVKLCARCVITTIDQQTGEKNKEPLKTLSTYRMRDNKVYFGQNLLYNNTGTLHAGDKITLL
ncbi:MOSC domain-containing protein [Panacibacter ginsenosidivorans]|uniref:MOSC domain-containing protein n=1 Tax=Panacibacter ginsenosidivorans TaxID=1813871 RepID=A0A5B8VFC4_9BACT|nr:MOSC N-terminal beta barrel domain-containing protein [Panacibacter ginsenosidivorans]QEC69803.1 MOSC domain-containing protein [Panacibacter ginsenosidivorans]